MNTSLTRRLFIHTVCAATLCGVSSSFAAEDARTFELRIYTTHEGKLPDLLSRFRDHTCQLFEKHGMENIGYWVPIEKDDGADNTLLYIISHKSRDAAKASWSAFSKDPEWQAAAKASEVNGKILAKKPESIFLKATDYSCPIQPGLGKAERVFEMRTYTTPEGKLDALHKRFRDHTTGLFTKHGITNIGYWTPTDAEQDAATKLIYVISHPSKEAGLKSFAQFKADPDWIAAKKESEKEGPLTLQPNGVKSIYMKATDFSPIR
jgi:hypothetical protein